MLVVVLVVKRNLSIVYSLISLIGISFFLQNLNNSSSMKNLGIACLGVALLLAVVHSGKN